MQLANMENLDLKTARESVSRKQLLKAGDGTVRISGSRKSRKNASMNVAREVYHSIQHVVEPTKRTIIQNAKRDERRSNHASQGLLNRKGVDSPLRVVPPLPYVGARKRS